DVIFASFYLDFNIVRCLNLFTNVNMNLFLPSFINPCGSFGLLLSLSSAPTERLLPLREPKSAPKYLATVNKK
ncbi:MAG: hypothetical protein K2N05_11575, partial [Muribaculaceae bacterium]|nr:hypothetical protein [Muribaculaceae bacterium]